MNPNNLNHLSRIFKLDDGQPFTLTETQGQIFRTILQRTPSRNIIITPTQYGKSLTVACAVLLRSVLFNEKWVIVAPTQAKAQIIMNYIILHLFDSPIFLSQIVPDVPLEKLKMERSRTRVVWKNGGEIFTVSADARNRKHLMDSLMGFGAPNLVLDESGLLEDDLYAGVKRMVGGTADNFILEIGNPFRRNHFHRTWNNNAYKRVFVDWQIAVKEGRITQSHIDEMRTEAFFDVMYECRFPEEDEIDASGYRRLLSDAYIEGAMKRKVKPEGKLRLGVDIGRGGDYSAYVIRWGNYAKVLSKNRSADLMTQVHLVKGYIREYQISPGNVSVDDIGVGGGVTDRLRELGLTVQGVRTGEASSEENYMNLKMEYSWECRKWILDPKNALEDNRDFAQLNILKYKENSSGKLHMESKDDLLLKRGVKSPDVADALILTFSPSADYNIRFL